MPHPEKYINEQGYMTPRDPYILAVEETFGGQICLDPASSETANQLVQAKYYYDGWPVDGLIFGWNRDIAHLHGHRGEMRGTEDYWWTVFLNPPYGRLDGDTGPFNVVLWTARMVKDFNRGVFDEGILLVNAFTGAKWFQKLWDFPICFTDHRIKFVNPATMETDNQPGYYNAFVYMGVRSQRFIKAFDSIGKIAVGLNRDGWG